MHNLNSYNRIVIKIGSAVVVDPRGKINHLFLANLASDIAWLKKKQKEVIVVSSGAIALGRKNIALPMASSLAESQALAAHGQIELMIAWKKHLNKHSIHVGQMLLTPRETELKISSDNAKQTIAKLLEVGCLPVINENDSTATDEIKFGDNDLLAAKISKLFKADLLVVLSSVDGLYSSESDVKNNNALGLIREVSKITPKIKSMGGQASGSGKGGMISKIEAADICFKNKCDMVITSGNKKKPISGLNARARATWFVKK